MNFLASKKKFIKISDGTACKGAGGFIERYERSLADSSAELAAFHLREFDISEPSLFEISRHFRELTSKLGLGFIVHRDPFLAKAVKADALHLQIASLDEINKAKTEMLIGVSCHSIEEALLAEGAGADYVYLSPIFEPISKSVEASPLGLEALLEAKKSVKIPVIALGGVSIQNIEQVCPTEFDKAAGIAGGVTELER